MSTLNEHFTWLQKEFPLWLERQWMTQDALSEIQRHYQNQLQTQQQRSSHILLAVLGSISALLMAGGVILLLAYNWDMLPKVLRIILAFCPLAGASVLAMFTLLRDKGAGFQESSVMALAAGSGCAIALVSQIYQIQGSLSDFLTVFIALNLPLFYLFRSAASPLILIFSIFALLFSGGDSKIALELYVVLLLPGLWYRLLTNLKSYDGALMGYLLLPLFSGLLLGEDDLSGFGQILLGILAIACFQVALKLRHNGVPLLRNALLWQSALVLLIYLVGGGSPAADDFWNVRDHSWYDFWIMTTEHIPLFLAVLFLVLWGIASNIRHKNPAGCVLWGFAVLLFLPLFAPGNEVMLTLLQFFGAVFCGGYGLFLILSGGIRGSLWRLNYGLLLILALVLCYLLDVKGSLLWRGLAFVALGLSIGAINLLTLRKINKRSVTQIDMKQGASK